MTETDGTPTSETEARRETRLEQLIELLASGATYAEAARLARCSARTVQRHMADPDFARRVSVRRGERIAQLTGMLTGLGPDALAAIRSCLNDPEASVRLRAAQLTLSMVVRLRSQGELDERLTELERRAGIGPAVQAWSDLSGERRQ